MFSHDLIPQVAARAVCAVEAEGGQCCPAAAAIAQSIDFMALAWPPRAVRACDLGAP